MKKRIVNNVSKGFIVLSLLTLGWSVNAATTPSASYLYSLVAPGSNGTNLLYARLIIEQNNALCPDLTGSNGKPVKTQVRPLNLSDGQQFDTANFPVTVCEAIIETGVSYTESNSGLRLDAASFTTPNIQVYGDSGCKSGVCGFSGPSAEFQALSNLGSQQAGSLLLHMGDYNYRGTSAHFANKPNPDNPGQIEKIYAYDAGDTPNPEPSCSYNDTYYSQNAVNSPKPDNWQTWNVDFFKPAAALLSKAPWVFTRGNHELCSRAGVGWFYFLGPGSSLAGSKFQQMQCPDQGDFNAPPTSAAGHVTVIPSYMLNFDRLRIWVTDSANACDDFAHNPLTRDYQTQYSRLAQQASNAFPTWVIGHRPIWGYQGGPYSLNHMQQVAIRNTQNKALPSSVQLSLAGHMHIYESITFLDEQNQPTGRPPQIVIGNSGVSLGGAPGNLVKHHLDNQRAVINSDDTRYGYLQMSVDAAGQWSGQVWQADKAIIANCDSANPNQGKPICDMVTEATTASD